jgi:dTDP-4-dehydrorhamnose 3,5-epimerase
MELEESPLKGCFVVKPRFFKDSRGFFYESYHQQKLEAALGTSVTFVQDNLSRSGYGVLRGLHFQRGAAAQAKLVSVLRGEVLDVCVDLRSGSPTYRQHFSLLLSEENRTQLFIPRGFAHGFVVLSQEADFFYKCDNFYNPAAEGGIRYDDPAFGIDWKLPASVLTISEKDQKLPFLTSARL